MLQTFLNDKSVCSSDRRNAANKKKINVSNEQDLKFDTCIVLLESYAR